MPDKRRFLNCEPPGGGTLRSSRRDVRRCPTGCLAPRLPRRADRAVAAKRQWVRAQAHRFHTSGSVGGASRGAPSFCFPSCPHRRLGTPAAAQTGFGLPGLPRRSAGSAGRLGLPHAAAAQAARGSRRQAAADAEEAPAIKAAAVQRAIEPGRPTGIRTEPLPAGGNVVGYNDFWNDGGARLVDDRRTSLIVDPPDGRVPSPRPGAPQQFAADDDDDDLAAPPHRPVRFLVGGIGMHGPEDRGLAERCLLGFNSGPPIVPVLPPGAATTRTCSSFRRRTTWSSSPRWCTRRVSCRSMGGTSCRTASVSGWAAHAAAGGQHAGARDDQLHRQDGELRPVHAPPDRDGPATTTPVATTTPTTNRNDDQRDASMMLLRPGTATAPAWLRGRSIDPAACRATPEAQTPRPDVSGRFLSPLGSSRGGELRCRRENRPASPPLDRRGRRHRTLSIRELVRRPDIAGTDRPANATAGGVLAGSGRAGNRLGVLQGLDPAVGGEGLAHLREVAVEHLRQPVRGEADAVVGPPGSAGSCRCGSSPIAPRCRPGSCGPGRSRRAGAVAPSRRAASAAPSSPSPCSLICDFSSCCETTSPVGRWVMRTAE